MTQEINDEKWNKKYLEDGRWKEAKRLTKLCKFNEANTLVNQIRKDYDLKYR